MSVNGGSNNVDDDNKVPVLFPHLVEPPGFQPDRVVSGDLAPCVPDSVRPDP